MAEPSCFHKFAEKEVKALFDKFDTNHDHVIDKEEFAILLKDVTGKEPTKDEVEKIFKIVDENGDGQISYGELKHAFAQAEPSCFHKFSEEEVKTLFQKFDSNHDQIIDMPEFEKLLTEVQGKAPSKEDVEKIFKIVDENSDGQISYGELKHAFSNA